ncbi:DNA repair protein XRCC3 homolog [Scaptodrosophila lebanonensis]|uniref:DNA repair protein XRCC3 homolog n=1 Tax=Drosophila lebanonensis TaxID=7225 RepID=A0A6J2T687_DROLE|nr:DNA repair protein XRCC3 homolog [Scaptodrosophila lebanonensis]
MSTPTSIAMTNFLDQLPKHIREMAERVNVLSPEVMLTTPRIKFLDTRTKELDSLVHKCTPEDVRVLKEAAAKWLAETLVSNGSLFRPLVFTKLSRLTFGCAALDRCTGGGVITRGITEICGPAGVGKTQLLLQLSLCVQLPVSLGGLGKGVAYICTEHLFPSRRLLQISKAFEKRHHDKKFNYLGNIYIEQLYDNELLLECVLQRLPRLLQKYDIGLIIIDSVATVFRLYPDISQRARDMRRLANALLSYAEKYNLAVICVNKLESLPCLAAGKLQDVPPLVLHWAHLGRTRMLITKVPKQRIVANELLTVRKLEIMYSPETPNAFAEFLITIEGVIDVPPPELEMPGRKIHRD